MTELMVALVVVGVLATVMYKMNAPLFASRAPGPDPDEDGEADDEYEELEDLAVRLTAAEAQIAALTSACADHEPRLTRLERRQTGEALSKVVGRGNGLRRGRAP